MGRISLDNPPTVRLNRFCLSANRRGAVAQLGARVTGSHEATGSNPVSSTIKFNGFSSFVTFSISGGGGP